jgi:hypothetical protein
MKYYYQSTTHYVTKYLNLLIQEVCILGMLAAT